MIFANTATKGQSDVPVLDAARQLAVDKVVRQINFIGRSYGLGEIIHDDLRHDLCVIHAHGNLAAIHVQLLNASREVVVEFKFEFSCTGAMIGGRDVAGGIELPLINRALIQSHRLLAPSNGKPRSYLHLLKLKWTDAEKLKRQQGQAFRSDHAAAITGGRQSGEFFVGEGLRYTLRVVEAGDRPFAFAQILDRQNAGLKVYLHIRYAPAGTRWAVGQRLRATIIQVPKGLQARNIEILA